MPDDEPDPRGIAIFGVPRTITGRRAFIELNLVYSRHHRPLDGVLHGYLRGLGCHEDTKYPGVPHLRETFHVSDRTMRRALERLVDEHEELYPAYLIRSRAGRRKGQTTATTALKPGLSIPVPWELITDVTTRLITPRDFQVWCAIQDHTSKPDADGRRPPDDGFLRFALTDVLAQLGSTNTANPRHSFVYRSVRALEGVGWLVLAEKPGDDHLIAVPLQRLGRDDRVHLETILNAVRPGLIPTRHRDDRTSLEGMGTKPPQPGDDPAPAGDAPVDNATPTIPTRHRDDRPTRHRDDRAKEERSSASTDLLKEQDQVDPPASPRPTLVPVLPLIPRPGRRLRPADRPRTTPRGS